MSRPTIALPWTRVITGPFRGTRVRATHAGEVLARITRDDMKAAADNMLRVAGYLVVDAPAGCQMDG